MAHDRPARVAEEFQHEVSAILTRGLKDPRVVGFITVTGAKMSPDLREVTVFVSVHGDEAVKRKTVEGLTAATGFIQREAARNLRLRVVPHMRFEWDASIEEGDKIERLLREAKEKDGR
jgi:ribosome-binding factor A